MNAHITTTLGQLAGAEGALQRLGDLRLPVKPAYHLAKLLKLAREELQHWHTAREAFIKELGVEREPTGAERVRFGPGKITAVMPEHEPEFRRRLDELAAIEVTLAWAPVDLAALGAAEISAADLAALGPLVTMTEAAAA